MTFSTRDSSPALKGGECVNNEQTDWRALCAELVEKIKYTWGDIPEDVLDLLDRVSTALAQPEPESASTHLAARPLLERVACIDQRTVGEIIAISNQAEAWLSGNPPGQPVAIEPRGCPTPGACSCVEPAAQPEPEGVTEEQWDAIKERLWDNYETVGNQGERFMYEGDFYDALDVARQDLARFGRPAAKPVLVAERLPEPGKKVLAHYLNALGKPRTIIAEWVPAKTREDSPDGDLGEYDDETDLFYWPEGWYEQIENWDDFAALLVSEGEITHWQPLPVVPELTTPR